MDNVWIGMNAEVFGKHYCQSCTYGPFVSDKCCSVGDCGPVVGPLAFKARDPKPADPKSEAVKCPNCGKNMATLENNAYQCNTSDCQLCSGIFTASFIKRVTIAPEPLTCPRCGASVKADRLCGGSKQKVLCECGLAGPYRLTADEAESEFRKLRYVKEGA